ncbi:MAG: helix-turn-helix transcriptional regulator [Bradymonadaceae bacterium]
MASRNTFAASRRSHEILKWLQNGRDVRIQDIVDEFGIKYPQARADLKLLEELYGLSTHREGRTKVWTWSGLNPDYVDLATVAALELGAISLDLFKDTPYGQAIRRLVDYCRDLVPEAHQSRLERLSDALHLRHDWLPTQPGRILEHLETSLNALWVADVRWLIGTYEKSNGTTKRYLLLPRRLIWYQGRLWLLALDRDVLKLFDLGGFEALERYRPSEHGVSYLDDAAADGGRGTDGDEVAHPVEYDAEDLEAYLEEFDDDPETYFEDAFGIFAQNYPVESIHLEVQGRWRNYLERYRLHASQHTEADGESLHVHLEMGICPEFTSFVMGMLPDVKVHAPDSLRDDLRQRAEQWLDR